MNPITNSSHSSQHTVIENEISTEKYESPLGNVLVHLHEPSLPGQPMQTKAWLILAGDSM